MLSLVGLSLSAQVYYSEDFEAETIDTEPSTFTVYNEDNCTLNNAASFPNGAWIVSDNGDAQGQFAAAQSWTNPAGCTVDDWLITPAIDLSGATANTSLNWKGISFEGPNYPETYEVRISTTDTAIASFDSVLTTIAPEAENWTDHSINLGAYVGAGDVYIAFRLISTDQSQCWIDDIIISEPARFDMAVTAVNTNGVNQTSAFSSGQFLIVDYSERTNFQADVVVENIGTDPVDSLYLTYFLVDDLNAPTEGAAFGDTVFVAGSIAPGATYTHTFEAFGLDTLFPFLASDQVLDFYVQIDSSSWNTVSNAEDFNYNILIAPAESYTAPYSSSFEVADLGAGVFLFDHFTWGWKYLDNDGDGVSVTVSNDFTNLPAQDGSMQLYGSLNGNSLSLAAEDETAETPELTLTGGTAYSFSVYARTGFGVTGSFSLEVNTDAGSYTNTIGSFNLAAGDSTYTKYSADLVIPSTQEDYVVRINKEATGFVVWDLFEIEELQQPTASISLNAASIDEPGVEYCDSTVTVNFSAQGNPSSLSLDWGDGTVDDVTGLTSATHTYGAFGTYTIEISATNIVGSGTADVALDFTATPAPTVTVGTPTINDLDVSFTIGNTAGSTNIVFTPECSRIIVDWGDGVIDEIFSASAAHSYTQAGTYTVTVTIIGTGTATGTVEVTVTEASTNIQDINFADALSIFPNPSNDFVNVSFGLNAAQDIEIKLYTVSGKMVDARSFTNVKDVNASFNTADLNNGVYLMQITTDKGTSTQKFVVSHQ